MTPEIKTDVPSLNLRFLNEEDAEELFLRIDQNREHLRRWMPWLDGAKGPSDQLKFIQRCSEGAVAGTAFHYVLLSGGEIVGMISFNFTETKIARAVATDEPRQTTNYPGATISRSGASGPTDQSQHCGEPEVA